MSILNTLTDEMKNAMKARDQVRLDAIRMLISAIKYAMVDLRAQAGKPDLDEAGMMAVLAKEAKKRREAVEAYRAAGRSESADKEQFELTLIEGYLPKMMSEEEIVEKLGTVKEQLMGKNMGEAMKLAREILGAGAEGGVVAKVVKELLQA